METATPRPAATGSGHSKRPREGELSARVPAARRMRSKGLHYCARTLQALDAGRETPVRHPERKSRRLHREREPQNTI